jgi:hypothetical protein
LVRTDAALGKDISRDCNSRHGIGPTGIKGEVRDDFGELGRLDTVVERQADVARQLDGLVASDQCCHGDDAAVTQ